jgi:hypothetical protein
MVPFEDWFPPAITGLALLTMGVLKLYGRNRGIVGGGDKPWRQRLLAGSCPTWSRSVNLMVPYVFLGLGLANLGYVTWLFLAK